jgi:uncharacterized protein GlcG (DUF336 family)
VVAANLGRWEEDMPRSYTTLTLDDAKRMLQAGEAAAARTGIAYNIAVVDAGGNLLAFVRQDGALIGSIDLAIGKAVTARRSRRRYSRNSLSQARRCSAFRKPTRDGS